MSRETEIEKIGRLPDCTVLTKKQTAALMGVSQTTLQKLGPDGPPRVQLSAYRIGYPLGGFREWLRRRQMTELLPQQGGRQAITGDAAA